MTIIGVHNGSVEKALPYILAVFLLSGIFQIGLGFLGLGKYIKYIPYPVVSGFMTAIGVIILITQILPLIGYDAKKDIELVESYRPVAEQSLLEKILVCKGKADKLAMRDPRNVKELKDRIVWERLKKILTHRYGRYTD